MAVAAVARLLLPRLSIWRTQDNACPAVGTTPPGVSTGQGLGGPRALCSLTWFSVSRLGTSQYVRPATWSPPWPAGPCLTTKRWGGPGARRSLVRKVRAWFWGSLACRGAGGAVGGSQGTALT